MGRFQLRCLGVAAVAGVVLTTGCGDPPTGQVIDVDDDSLSLAIDFATYLGGAAEDIVRDIAFDAQGNLYVAGGTKSADFPTSPGVLDGSFNPTGTYLSDVFVSKFNPSGQLVWSTFLGGPDFDRVYGIEVDAAGFVYIAGRAGIGFPVTPGTVQTVFGGSSNPEASGPTDGFICKLTPDGSQVVFCTYLGNKDFVFNRDMAIDANGDIYLGSSMDASDTFPSAWFANAYQKTRRGGRDALIVKLRGDGTGVVWATLLGGSDEESAGTTVRVDATGVYVAISTRSPDLPTPNGFDHALDGSSDLYVAKLSPDGSQLLYGTYVGGNGREDTETHHLAVNGQGNAFAAVGSTSSNAPTTAGAFQTGFGGGTDVLLVKLTPTGGLAAGTYVGAGGNEWAEGIALDPAGNVYFSGGTSSPDFPVSGGQAPGGGTDLTAVALSSDLSKLLFSRRLGGSGDETGRAVAVSATAFAVAGQGNTPNWPVASALQSGARGGIDGLVAVFGKRP